MRAPVKERGGYMPGEQRDPKEDPDMKKKRKKGSVKIQRCQRQEAKSGLTGGHTKGNPSNDRVTVKSQEIQRAGKREKLGTYKRRRKRLQGRDTSSD